MNSSLISYKGTFGIKTQIFSAKIDFMHFLEIKILFLKSLNNFFGFFQLTSLEGACMGIAPY